jgi:hypothetical protein
MGKNSTIRSAVIFEAFGFDSFTYIGSSSFINSWAKRKIRLRVKKKAFPIFFSPFFSQNINLSLFLGEAHRNP